MPKVSVEMTENEVRDLVGKTISEVKYDSMYADVEFYFTDGSEVQVSCDRDEGFSITHLKPMSNGTILSGELETHGLYEGVWDGNSVEVYKDNHKLPVVITTEESVEIQTPVYIRVNSNNKVVVWYHYWWTQ